MYFISPSSRGDAFRLAVHVVGSIGDSFSIVCIAKPKPTAHAHGRIGFLLNALAPDSLTTHQLQVKHVPKRDGRLAMKPIRSMANVLWFELDNWSSAEPNAESTLSSFWQFHSTPLEDRTGIDCGRTSAHNPTCIILDASHVDQKRLR